jgi:hypothetical protein
MAVKGLVEAEVVTDPGPGGLTKGSIPFCSTKARTSCSRVRLGIDHVTIKSPPKASQQNKGSVPEMPALLRPDHHATPELTI